MCGYDEIFENCTYLHSYKQGLNIFSPILLFVGTVGNILSFVVLLRKNLRKQSTYNYLAVLSVTDTGVLYFGLLQFYLEEVYCIHVGSNWGCRLLYLFKLTVTDYSVWLIIAVTVERYIATVHTLHAKVMCTRKRAAVVMVIIFLLLVAINSHFLFSVKYFTFTLDGKTHSQCMGIYETFMTEIWPVCDAFIYSFAPFIIIIVMNTIIIYTVKHRHSFMASNGKSQGEIQREMKLTVMLIMISFTFLITTVPVNITMIVVRLLRNSTKDICQVFFLTKSIKAVVSMLMYVNHSMNVFLYLLTGQKFRQELFMFLRELCCKKDKRVSNNSSMYTMIERSSTRTKSTKAVSNVSQKSVVKDNGL